MNYRISDYPSNTICKWTTADSLELFEKNTIKYGNDNKSIRHYKENPIKYSFNNYGFRTPDDFNEVDEGNVFLGDSNTMGTGHHLENTWSYKINQDVGGKFWNLSQGGHGIQTDYRLLYGWKDHLKIKNIFHFTINHSRFEFFNKSELLQMNNWSEFKHKDFYLDFLCDEGYCEFIEETYINAIKGLSKEIGCNYYYVKLAESFYDYDKSTDDSLEARDLSHMTVKYQNCIYEKFKELNVK
tara:strand:+ start:4651 stop:5373 length:723 start_codon:yes stop_codon:yes gene_type:complete